MSENLVIACYDSIDDTDPQVLDVTWTELEEWLADFEVTQCQHTSAKERKHCPSKTGSCWSPVDIKLERKDMNVLSVTAAVFDIDGISEEDLRKLLEDLKPWTFIAHSTHSHRAESASLRLVMQLSRPVRPVEWPRVWSEIISTLKLPADDKCKNLSRVYFLPRVSEGEVKFFHKNRGKPLDVDYFFETKTPVVKEAPVAALGLNSRDFEDLEGVRATLAAAANSRARSKHPAKPEREAADRANAKSLKLILEQKPFALPGDWSGPNPDGLPVGRDDALNRIMSVIANVVVPGTHFNTISPIIRMSVGAMAAPEGIDHWLEKAESMYTRAARRRQEREDANRDAVERTKASFTNFLQRRIRDRDLKMHGGTKPAAAAVEEDEEPVEDEEDYETWLQRDDDGNIKSNGHNVYVILSEAPDFKGFIRFNLLSKQIEVTGGILKGEGAETLATAAADWIQFRWKINVGLADTRARLVRVARDNPYDPVREYLEGLVWDGTPRLFDWLVKYCAAQTVDVDGNDVEHWVRLVGVKWMVGLVARALEPGCQNDVVLVLEGDQGVGKTSLLRVISQPWHRDDKLVLGEKDARMAAGASWIVELGELSALKRGDVETYKAFFSQKTDAFRLPYGQAIEEFPRRCVFVGTTNETDAGYLPDLTGNRRYWPIRIGGEVKLKELAAVRDQLLAEAVKDFKEGETWYFDRNDAKEFERQVTERRVADPNVVSEAVARWWRTQRTKPDCVTTHHIAVEVLGMEPMKVQRGDEIRIGYALAALGFHRRRELHDGRRRWVFRAPKEGSRESKGLQVCETVEPRKVGSDPGSAVRDAAGDVAGEA